VFDEPNSNLDADGDISLATAIQGIRQRGGIVIVVAHRPSALAYLDQVLVMAGGTMQAFGPKDEVLASVTRPAAQAQPAAAERGSQTVVPLHDRR
jgi:ABC-type protease/lipase transport system fused ATPase/permease subunit